MDSNVSADHVVPMLFAADSRLGRQPGSDHG